VKVIAGRRGSSSWSGAWDGVGRERRSLISWRIRRETRAFVAVPNKDAYQVVWRYNNRSISAVGFDNPLCRVESRTWIVCPWRTAN
jgi:hypothetical protein